MQQPPPPAEQNEVAVLLRAMREEVTRLHAEMVALKAEIARFRGIERRALQQIIADIERCDRDNR